MTQTTAVCECKYCHFKFINDLQQAENKSDRKSWCANKYTDVHKVSKHDTYETSRQRCSFTGKKTSHHLSIVTVFFNCFRHVCRSVCIQEIYNSSNNTNSTMHDVIYNVRLTLNKLIIYGKSWLHLQTEAPLFSNSLFTAGQKCTCLYEPSKSAVMGQYCSLRWQWKQKQSKTQSEPVIHNHVAGFWSSKWQFAVNSPQKKSIGHYFKSYLPCKQRRRSATT